MTNWYLPTLADVQAAYGSIFVPPDAGDYDPVATATFWLTPIVNLIRQAILNGNRTALSLTAGTVPPEAQVHVLTLVAEKVIANSPRMVGYIVVEGGSGPMVRPIAEARKFVEDCKHGLATTVPTDPDPDTLPSGTKWGDDSGVGTPNTVITDMTIDAPPF